MRRKLVKQGRNAMTVTLPAEWIKENRLDGGDEVDLEIIDNMIEIFPAKKKKTSEKIELELKNYERAKAFHSVFARYIEGYDRIIINHNNQKLMQNIGNVLYGMAIEENTGTRTVLQNIIAVPEENIDVLIRRSSNLLVEHSRFLLKVLEKEMTYEELKMHERILDNMILYCMRHINKYQYGKDSYKLFQLISTIEFAADQISKIAKYTKRRDICEKVIKGTEDFVKNLIKSDMNSMYKELREFRDSVEGDSFVHGLAYSLAESLYNNMAYIIQDKKRKR